MGFSFLPIGASFVAGAGKTLTGNNKTPMILGSHTFVNKLGEKGWVNDELAPLCVVSRGSDGHLTDESERGDWGREHVLDPVMLSRSTERHFGRTLGVGCGEGRLCRMNYSERE